MYEVVVGAIKLKKVINQPTIIFPFDEYHKSYSCPKCGRLLRYSAIHEKVYVVSEFGDHSEIIRRNHNCSKDSTKNRGNKK